MTIEEFLKKLPKAAKGFEWEINNRILGRVSKIDFAFTPLSAVSTMFMPSKTTRLWHENELTARDLGLEEEDARLILKALDKGCPGSGTEANKLRNRIIYILLSQTIPTMKSSRK